MRQNAHSAAARRVSVDDALSRRSMAWGDSTTTVRRRVARNERPCGVGVAAYCSGDGRIRAGEPYIEWTEFPGGDAGYADHAGHPVRMSECRACAIRAGRAELVDEETADVR